jgi:hypothetical protein
MSGLLKAGIIRGRPHGARAEKAVPFPSPAFKHLRSDLIKMSAIAASISLRLVGGITPGSRVPALGDAEHDFP